MTLLKFSLAKFNQIYFRVQLIMKTIGSKCFAAGCSRLPKYYCCDPAKPACSSCSQLSCDFCHIKRNKPLKALSKQLSLPTVQVCFKCNEKQCENSVHFPCKHSMCPRCICETVCKFIKDHKWTDKSEKEKQQIACSCSDHQTSNISTVLEKYCFCCGKSVQKSESFKLDNGLILRVACKNRFKYEEQLLQDSKRQFLTKKQIEPLLRKEKKIEPKIKQITQIQKPVEKKVQQQPRTKVVSLKKPEKRKQNQCLQCSAFFYVVDHESQTLLCNVCLEKQHAKILEQQKKREEAKNEVQNKYVKELSFVKKKVDLKSIREQEISGLKQEIIKNQAQDTYIFCVCCDKKQQISKTNTISQQIGQFLCQKCYQEQHQLLEKSTKSKCQQNTKAKKKVKNNLYFKYILQLQGFPSFGKNINLDQQVGSRNIQKTRRELLPSIIQEQPSPIQLCIDQNQITSCFNCGLFVDYDNLIYHQIAYFCLTCLFHREARKK